MSQVDEQLVALLNRRASLYLEKMKGVQTPSKIMFSDQDQQQVWALIDRLNQGPLTSAELKTIFRPLMSAGRQQIKSLRVAYLGPAFSFTHQAAISRFGEAADFHISALFALGFLLFVITFIVLGLAKWMMLRAEKAKGF